MKNRSGQWARDRSRSPAVPIPTTEMSANGQSAIKFELNWIKFVKDAEDDYNRRLSRVSAFIPFPYFGDDFNNKNALPNNLSVYLIYIE